MRQQHEKEMKNNYQRNKKVSLKSNFEKMSWLSQSRPVNLLIT